MKQRKKSENKNQIYFFLGVVGLFLLCFLMYGSNLPYVGYNAWNFNTYSLIAHNYNAFGLLAAQFAPIISVSSTLPENPSYYFNHPPLLSVLIALVFRVVGESFWSGRLVNIFAAFSSCVLLYAIAKEIAGVLYARAVFLSCLLIPAAVIFGRMIGQESLVLFFGLLCIYAFLRFLKTRKRKWLVISAFSIVLGTFTDWVMVYFTFSMAPFLIYKKQKKVFALFLTLTVLAALLYITYVYLIVKDVTFLYEGFSNRSSGELLQKNNWGYVWITTMLSRLLVYFNPFWMGLFLLYFLLKRQWENRSVFILTSSLLLFGLLHIVLYPEGSYGHPYWMYYLFPGIALGSAAAVHRLWKSNKVIVTLCVVLSLTYVFSVVLWKTKETIGSVFRYQLAEVASSRIPDYTPILINRTGPIDPDLFQFVFHHPTVILEPTQKKIPSHPFGAVVYSCLPSCDDEQEQLSIFEKRYNATRFLGNNLEMWVFMNDNKPKVKLETEQLVVSLPESSGSFISELYQNFMKFTSAPQL